MMADLLIQEATKQHASACARIVNEWIDATDWMPRVHSHQDVALYYQETVFPERDVFVASDNENAVAGFVALDRESGLVTALYVDSEYSRRGVGAALIGRVQSEQPNGFDLWTFVANEPARHFYSRLGFVEVRRTTGENEEALPDILLRWSPTPEAFK